MDKIIKDFKGYFIDQGFDAIETDHERRGFHLEVVLDANQVRKFAETAYELGFYLVFVTGFHVRPDEENNTGNSGLEVVYQFARYDRQYRMKARASVPDNKEIPSISDIYQGANWHERETRDFFGVIFDGHPNLNPLLLSEEDADFHPLLKEETKLKSIKEVSWTSEAPKVAEKEPETGTSS
ncbi:MAG: NADH-quinone oxidoreductase subunit C [Desulfobacterales bacterium]